MNSSANAEPQRKLLDRFTPLQSPNRKYMCICTYTCLHVWYTHIHTCIHTSILKYVIFTYTFNIIEKGQNFVRSYSGLSSCRKLVHALEGDVGGYAGGSDPRRPRPRLWTEQSRGVPASLPLPRCVTAGFLGCGKPRRLFSPLPGWVLTGRWSPAGTAQRSFRHSPCPEPHNVEGFVTWTTNSRLQITVSIFISKNILTLTTILMLSWLNFSREQMDVWVISSTSNKDKNVMFIRYFRILKIMIGSPNTVLRTLKDTGLGIINYFSRVQY